MMSAALPALRQTAIHVIPISLALSYVPVFFMALTTLTRQTTDALLNRNIKYITCDFTKEQHSQSRVLVCRHELSTSVLSFPVNTASSLPANHVVRRHCKHQNHQYNVSHTQQKSQRLLGHVVFTRQSCHRYWYSNGILSIPVSERHFEHLL